MCESHRWDIIRIGPTATDRLLDLSTICKCSTRGRERRVGTPFDLQSDACIGCGACAKIRPTGAVKIDDQSNKRILDTWNTTVQLHPCPDCGRFFAPEPTVFLKEMLPDVADLQGLCPDCYQRRTARQWIEQCET